MTTSSLQSWGEREREDRRPLKRLSVLVTGARKACQAASQCEANAGVARFTGHEQGCWRFRAGLGRHWHGVLQRPDGGTIDADWLSAAVF